MRLKLKIQLLVTLLIANLAVFAQTNSTAVTQEIKQGNTVIIDAMQAELSRSMSILGKKGTPPPYFISYQLTDQTQAEVTASLGALITTGIGRSRLLDADVRVGSPKLDNTHAIRGTNSSGGGDYSSSIPITIEDDPDSIKAAIWLQTDSQYKAAVEKLILIEADKGVTVTEEDQSDDFSKADVQVFFGPPAKIAPDLPFWEKKIREYSAMFNDYPSIHHSEVSMHAVAQDKYFVNSEGTKLIHGFTHWRLSFSASTLGEDGMQVYKNESFDARTVDRLPEEKIIKRAITKLIVDLLALNNAPLMEPYTGPAILSGRATAVFFHEIFGHRIEGHRQKDETEGQTFTQQVNKPVLPLFISVYDDPTRNRFNDIDLNGFYLYDDQGVKASRVNLVEQGILKNFLMSRSPIAGFLFSNGHGRAQAGQSPVSRQGVLIVESSKTVSMEQLRAMLRQECKKQGKPFGLYFDDISGGFTYTTRYMPQAFNVEPILVYRVYVDGRPDELVRGVDLIGTPLTSFSQIIACGDEPGIFNGYCGAESGTIPASAIAPAILTTQIEVQKKRKSAEKPPVLAPPHRRIK